jgi:hypothetical protein
LALLLVLAADSPKEDPAAGDRKQLQKVLTGLEKQTWEALQRHDAAAIKALWADDFHGVLASGLRRSKSEILKTLNDLTITSYALDEVGAVPLDQHAALLTYRLTRASSFAGKALPAKNSVTSVWVHREGKWRIVSYQETPIEE